MLIIAGYRFDWTGFNGYNKVTIAHNISGTNAGTVTKTEEYQPGKGLWDWLNLLGVLAIPIVAGFGVAWFTGLQQERDKRLEQAQHDRDQQLADQRAESERKAAEQQAQTEREVATDNQREAALQMYLDKMSELLLHEKLRESGKENVEVRILARARTLTTLRGLDSNRKGILLQFIYDTGLIDGGKPIIDFLAAEEWVNVRDNVGLVADLSEANLRGADLPGARLGRSKLRRADLREADLEEADLTGADLVFVNLRGAHLRGAHFFLANLRGADLEGADLSFARLQGAKNTTTEQLEKAKSLQGTEMPNGERHV